MPLQMLRPLVFKDLQRLLNMQEMPSEMDWTGIRPSQPLPLHLQNGSVLAVAL